MEQRNSSLGCAFRASITRLYPSFCAAKKHKTLLHASIHCAGVSQKASSGSFLVSYSEWRADHLLNKIYLGAPHHIQRNIVYDQFGTIPATTLPSVWKSCIKHAIIEFKIGKGYALENKNQMLLQVIFCPCFFSARTNEYRLGRILTFRKRHRPVPFQYPAQTCTGNLSSLPRQLECAGIRPVEPSISAAHAFTSSDTWMHDLRKCASDAEICYPCRGEARCPSHRKYDSRLMIFSNLGTSFCNLKWRSISIDFHYAWRTCWHPSALCPCLCSSNVAVPHILTKTCTRSVGARFRCSEAAATWRNWWTC